MTDDTDTRASLDEPIAIVGVACRLPGGVTCAEDLWELVSAGGDALTDFPSDRGWHPARLPATSSGGCRAGFVDAVTRFDPAFFGIPPHEAASMDPRQRLALEVSWEALERAGIVPSRLRETAVGVFTGTAASPEQVVAAPSPIDTANGMLSDRVARTFGLEGPAVTVDTADSSSLVALHLAALSLRGRDCDLALVGGFTVITGPDELTDSIRRGEWAADGRCKPFDAAADGTNRSEGAVVLVAERLSRARRHHRRVLAVVTSSAINQDGAATPSGPAQERLLRQALRRAGLGPDDVDAVEAHGTGVAEHDRVEARALLTVYGRRQADREPLWLGSLKANLGHTGAAAGLAGLVKMTMAMRHGTLAGGPHLRTPTPGVDWSSGAVEPLTAARPWPRGDRPRRAGVSAFGRGGTNVHVIVEEPAPSPTRPAASGAAGVTPLVLSGDSPASLRDQTARLRAHPRVALPDLGYSLAATRERLSERAVILAADHDALTERLDALAAADELPGLVRGTAIVAAPRPVFVFPGQGTQWIGMALELADSCPVFAAALDECAAALEPHVTWSLRRELASSLDRVEVVQPALWAVMVALARLWQSYGVTPAAVVGHSQGEVAAAVIAGALSLSDAATVVVARSRLIARRLSGHGGMVAVALGAEAVAERITAWPDQLFLASLNSPHSTVVSGETEALSQFVDACEDAGIRAQKIWADCAGHSPHVDAVRDELRTALAGLQPRDGDIPMYSTVTGDVVAGAGLDAGYWFDNQRRTVRLEPVVRDLLARGHDSFVEISPHPVLVKSLIDTADSAKARATILGSLRRDEGGLHRFLESVAEADVNGIAVDWTGAFGTANVVDLPTYAFQHQRYWNDAPATTSPVDAEHSGDLGTPFGDGSGGLLTTTLSTRETGWLRDHVIDGRVTVPVTVFVDLALRAGASLGLERLATLTFTAPLPILDSERIEMQTLVGAAVADGDRPVTVYSRPWRTVNEPWTVRATGTLTRAGDRRTEPLAWPPAKAHAVEVSALYEAFAGLGHRYGPALRGVTAAWRTADEVFAEISLPPEHRDRRTRHAVHPVLLEAALHGLLAKRSAAEVAPPRHVHTVSGVQAPTRDAVTARVRLSLDGPHTLGVRVVDPHGAEVAVIDTVTLRETAAATPPASHPPRLGDASRTAAFDDGRTVAESEVLDELERLSEKLTALRDDADREAVANRLRSMLRDVEGAGETAEDFDAATDDEMFALIDRELGLD